MPTEKRLYDYLQSFPLGINSDVDPLLLPKTQLAFALNATFRGDFIRQRPAFQKMGFMGDVPGAFNTGVFQDACRFSPSKGNEFIMLAIGGNLFQCKVNTDGTITALQVVLPDGLNAAIAQQPNWMWQAERWLIWNDGVNLPTFYDGNTARRSKGDSASFLASIISSFIVPPVGQTVNCQTALQYIGPSQIPVLLSGTNESATYTLESSFTSQTAAGRVPVTFAVVNQAGVGDQIAPGASFVLKNKYLGQILDVVDSSNNSLAAWPPAPVTSTGPTNDGTVADSNLGGVVVGGVMSATIDGAVYSAVNPGNWPAMTSPGSVAQNDQTVVDVTVNPALTIGGVNSVLIGGDAQSFWPASQGTGASAQNDNTVLIGGTAVAAVKTSSQSTFPPLPIAGVAVNEVTITVGASKPVLLSHFGCNGGAYYFYGGPAIMAPGDAITVAGVAVAVDTCTADGNGNVTSFTCHATNTGGSNVAVGSTFIPVSHAAKLGGTFSNNNGSVICPGVIYYLNTTSATPTMAVASNSGGPFNSGVAAVLNQFTITTTKAVTVAAGAPILVGGAACLVVTGGTNVSSLVLSLSNSAYIGQTIPIYVAAVSGKAIEFTMGMTQAFTGAVNDTLSVGGATMTVKVKNSSTSLTCQMTNNSFTSVSIPFYVPAGVVTPKLFSILLTAAFAGSVGNQLTCKPAAAPVGSGAAMTVSSISPDKLTLTVYLTNDVTGQTIPFYASGSAGIPNVVTLQMNSPVFANVGDTLIASLTSPGVGSVSLRVYASPYGNNVSVQVNAGVGLPIQKYTSGTPTLAQLVIDTNNVAAPSIGTYPLDNGVLPAPTLYLPVTVSTLQSNVLFLLPSGSASASVGQIIEVTNSTSTLDILYVQSLSQPTVAGASYYIQIKNQTDTPGASVNPGVVVYPIPEIPVSTIGAYGMGRNWVSMPDGKSFVAGDLIGSGSGSMDYNYNDAVLKVSQNQWLASAGTFVLPSAGNTITGMKFISSLDASLGQGPLQIFTDNTVFSCNTTTDMTEWAHLTSPILTESLVGSGAAGPFSIIQENNDIIFRSTDGGFRSMLIARLDYNKWGNTPISREVARSLKGDDPLLFPLSSTVVFNNRLLAAIGGKTGNRGVYQSKLAVLNFDALSSLQNKQPSIWEGEWGGLNILKLVSGMFNGVERCFAVCISSDQSSIEFHEITIDGSQGPDDTANDIAWGFESSTLFKDKSLESREYKRLINGEFYVDQIVDDVQVQAFYKPDQFPQWIPWYSTVINRAKDENGFRPRIGLGEPPSKFYDTVNNRPLREAYAFQVKFLITGQCRFVGARFAADVIPQPEFARPVSGGVFSPPASTASPTPITPPPIIPPPTSQAAPTNLVALAGDSQVVLTWGAAAGAVSYNILRSTLSGAETPLAAGVLDVNYTDSGLTNGVNYFYTVRAVGAIGTSSSSNEASATPSVPLSSPPAPSGLLATGGNSQVALSWNPAAGADSYNVLRSTVSGSETSLSPGITATNYLDSTAANGTKYYYVVTATNAAGTSANSSEASATPALSVPSAPTGVAAVYVAQYDYYGIYWNPAAGATGYNVYYSTVAGGPYLMGYPNASSGVYVGGAPAPTKYYVVTAYNSLGESPHSAEVHVP
jgi:hypothetical protein